MKNIYYKLIIQNNFRHIKVMFNNLKTQLKTLRMFITFQNC
jgi:hypothetical protein